MLAAHGYTAPSEKRLKVICLRVSLPCVSACLLRVCPRVSSVCLRVSACLFRVSPRVSCVCQPRVSLCESAQFARAHGLVGRARGGVEQACKHRTLAIANMADK